MKRRSRITSASGTETADAVPVLRGESAENRRFREMTFLNLYWFMAALLERKDRCSMYSGLEVRVPYADHRLVSYVFNTPPEIRAPQGVAKGFLRDACRGLLPDEILLRKKNPYPKTHSPRYEQVIRERLNDVLRDPEQPIHRLLSREASHDLFAGALRLRQAVVRPADGRAAAYGLSPAGQYLDEPL